MRFLLLFLILTQPAVVAAQVVQGRVLEGNSDQPVTVASIELLDDRGKVLLRAATDSLGNFRMRAWLTGKYQVRSSALGYRTITSELLELCTGDEFQLEVRLVAEAIDLKPVTITARSRSPLTEIALSGYYDRRDAGRHYRHG